MGFLPEANTATIIEEMEEIPYKIKQKKAGSLGFWTAMVFPTIYSRGEAKTKHWQCTVRPKKICAKRPSGSGQEFLHKENPATIMQRTR